MKCRMCGEEYDSHNKACPLCGDRETDDNLLSIAARVRRPTGRDISASTEKLETELRSISDQLATGQERFHQIRTELRNRRVAKDEQPVPKETTADQLRQAEVDNFREQVNVLSLKVTSMEAEQAKLVVEAEIFKAQAREAESKLALVVKNNTMVPKNIIDELTIALGNVPPGGASGDAPAWIIRLHRASCEVAGMQVVTKST